MRKRSGFPRLMFGPTLLSLSLAAAAQVTSQPRASTNSNAHDATTPSLQLFAALEGRFDLRGFGGIGSIDAGTQQQAKT